MDGGSLALWYHWKAAQKGQATRAAAEVHINLWRRRIKKLSNKEESFLDLGFRFKASSSISDFRLYLPFAISQSDIVDLGSILHDQTTMMAIFNEAYVA